eukprot:7869757-Heterocapsa_arctica.AAC.1
MVDDGYELRHDGDQRPSGSSSNLVAAQGRAGGQDTREASASRTTGRGEPCDASQGQGSRG